MAQVIITHKNGDFDALAAGVAASKIYPGSAVIMPEPLQTNVRSFVNLYRDLLPVCDPKDIPEEIDSLIVIDTNSKERLGNWAHLLERSEKIIVYDHHPGEETLGADLVTNEAVGATTTLLLEKIIEKKITLTEFETSLLALGIYEDTGCLTYGVTTSRDVKAVSYLWEKGIKINLIQEYLRSPLNDAQKQLLEELIKNSKLYDLNQRRVLISTTVLDQYVSGAAVIIQLLDEIEDAGITVIIVKMTENIFMAARTREGDLNLLELLAPYRVKGYKESVSAHFKGTDVEKVRNNLVDYLTANLPPAITADQVASSPVFTISSSTTTEEADRMLAERGYQGCPVVDEGLVVGIVSRRDLRKGLRNELGHAPVKGFMTRRIISASPGDSVTELRRILVEHNIGRVPIVNNEGKLTGIITRSDILRCLGFLDRKGKALKAKDQEIIPENAAAKSKVMEETLDDADKAAGKDPEDRDSISTLLNSELPVQVQKLLLQVSRQAENEGFEVYLVGGIIRDILLRYPPEKDLDFVVIGDAVNFTFSLQKILGGKVRHFEEFGTASLQLEDGLRLDLVTARKEFYATPAALPRVVSSSLKNDLYRRDFTINTMACSLEEGSYGRLYDYFDGRKDLSDELIRVLYKLSFVDDPLRILRAVRFEQRYNFTIEQETLALIENAVRRRVLNKVSRHRLNQELRLIYREPSPVRIMKRFEQLSLLSFLYPGVKPGRNDWRLLSDSENTLQWIAQHRWKQAPDPELVYLCALVCGLESVDRSAIIRKLNLSRDRSSIVLKACRDVPEALDRLKQEDLSPSDVVGCLDNMSMEALTLAFALTDSSEAKRNLELFMKALKYIRPSIKGNDLKKMGLKPGPRYQKIIDSLKQAVLDGRVRTPQEELDYVIDYLETEKMKEVY